ncbi:MAG: SPOR domain-containing protein [Xanthomonadaceae bacterium]|nr:SPOR domain-containing protein [Xanthomonadaceae bacterium]
MDASLKQRLVGAVVLVALAVIFLPMLIRSPAPDSGVSSVSMRIPAEPKTDAGPGSQDLPLQAPAAVPAGGVSGMPASVAEPAGAASVDPAAASADGVPMAAVAAGNFAVNFGSYASQADADKVIAALTGKGLPGYRDAVDINGKQAFRVRVGPFAARAMAESARLRASQIRKDVAIKVITLDAAPGTEPAVAAVAGKPESGPEPRLEVKPEVKAAVKPEPTKPAVGSKPETAKVETPKVEPPPAKPANPAGTGFVVQIGAFASAADATAQRDALRKAGFNAFTDTVPGQNGTLTRVRVGPVLTRTEADALKTRLKAAGKDGMVRPHP